MSMAMAPVDQTLYAMPQQADPNLMNILTVKQGEPPQYLLA